MLKNNIPTKSIIKLQDGRKIEAQTPVIVSASRSTDIPAFYCDWFFKRLKEGYSLWKNPFNNKSMYISYKNTRFIVFWSKNPRPLLKYLDQLDDFDIGCYIQFSINDYVNEGLEPGVPSLEERLDTFAMLVERIGKGGVIWRNDPLVLTDKINVDDLIIKTEKIGDSLHNLTEKLVFSFVDLNYTAIQNLKRANINYKEWTNEDKIKYAKYISEKNINWNFEIATCAEDIDLDNFGISHNKCIDDKLIIKRKWTDNELMKYLGVTISSALDPSCIPKNSIKIDDYTFATYNKISHDSGQRNSCGCIKSKDIGEYSTCKHYCAYCYANKGDSRVNNNYELHFKNPYSESITGFFKN